MLHRIQKILAETGLGSRRACEKLIIDGRVRVNGKTVKTGDKASYSDKITVDGNEVQAIEKKVYILLNKPRGYVVTVTEPFGMKTVFDLISVDERVFPVGRLDKESEGLLLLTNDGKAANRLSHPSKGVSKVYNARLNGVFKDMQKLLAGVNVEGRVVKIKARKLFPNEVQVEIHEGRKHIVRKVFAVLGYTVTRLVRVQFGPLKLKGLGKGQWRYLRDDEIRMLIA